MPSASASFMVAALVSLSETRKNAAAGMFVAEGAICWKKTSTSRFVSAAATVWHPIQAQLFVSEPDFAKKSRHEPSARKFVGHASERTTELDEVEIAVKHKLDTSPHPRIGDSPPSDLDSALPSRGDDAPLGGAFVPPCFAPAY